MQTFVGEETDRRRQLMIPMAGLIDKEAELAVTKRKLESVAALRATRQRAFVAKAPEAVIAKEREKLADYQSQLVKLKEQRNHQITAIV